MSMPVISDASLADLPSSISRSNRFSIDTACRVYKDI